MAIHQARGEVLTGLLYVDPDAGDLHTAMYTTAAPLNSLGVQKLRPGVSALEKLNASFR